MSDKKKAWTGKVVSVRFPDAAIHLKGRKYALDQGVSFGELVSMALAEYLRKPKPDRGA